MTAKPQIIFRFDGKGGVEQLAADAAVTEVPAKGFVLISGDPRSPEFIAWLREEIGAFNADLLVGTANRARCTVLDDKAIVGLRVIRPSKEDADKARQLLSIWLEKGRAIIASELNMTDFLNVAHWQQSRHAPTSPADLVARLGLRAADRLEPLIEQLGSKCR
jgi:zinc transporter